MTALLLILFIGAWSLVRGVLEIVGAIQLRKEIDNEWMLILSGVISILFGAAVMILPGAGALALVWLIGIYAVLFGISMIALSLRLKKMSVSARRARKARDCRREIVLEGLLGLRREEACVDGVGGDAREIAAREAQPLLYRREIGAEIAAEIAGSSELMVTHTPASSSRLRLCRAISRRRRAT